MLGVLLNQPVSLYYHPYATPILTPPTIEEDIALELGAGAAATATLAAMVVTSIAIDEGGGRVPGRPAGAVHRRGRVRRGGDRRD